jgi:hypothetical protein
MKAPSVPIAKINVNLDIEIEYNAFKGKDLDQFTDSVIDQLNDILMDEIPEIVGIASCLNKEPFVIGE